MPFQRGVDGRRGREVVAVEPDDELAFGDGRRDVDLEAVSDTSQVGSDGLASAGLPILQEGEHLEEVGGREDVVRGVLAGALVDGVARGDEGLGEGLVVLRDADADRDPLVEGDGDIGRGGIDEEVDDLGVDFHLCCG